MPAVVLWVLVWFLAGIMTGFAFVGASHLNKARKVQVRRQGADLEDNYYKTPEKRKPKKSKATSFTSHGVDSEADPVTLGKLTANLYKSKKGILAHTLSAKRGAGMGQATIRTRIQENHRGHDAVLVDTEARWKDHHLKRQWAQSVLLESMEPVLSKHLRHAIKSVLHFTSVGPETMDIKSTSQGIGNWESFVAPMAAPPPKMSGRPDMVAPEANNSKAPAVVHTILPGLSRSSSLIKPSTSQSNVAKTLQPPLPIEGSLNKPTVPPETPSVTTVPQPLEHDSQSNQASTPIIVRGFRSASVSRPAELTYPRPMSTTAGRAKELDVTITPIPSPRAPRAIRQTETPANRPPQVPDKDPVTTSTPLPTIPDSVTIEQQHLQQQQTSRPPSKPSRLWSKVRKVVNGGLSSSSTSIISIYQSAGGIASNLRSMSDTHLPYRPVSSTSTSSFNAAMPSFSSSVLSLLSDDQMSTTERPPLITSRHPSLAFETPPETAPSSPVSLSKNVRQHFLPDLARRSSTKSPAAKAELTPAESNVSHFVAARREEGRTRLTDSRPESMVEELGIRLEQGLIPKTSPRSSRLSAGSTHTRSNSMRPDEARLSNEEIPLSNRNSSLSFDQRTSGTITQDFDQFLTAHQGYIELDEAPTIPLQDESKSASPRHSAEIHRERMAALSKIEGRTESARNSLINTSDEDQRVSRMLLAPSADLLNPTKEDRRKSAISFGTYFSGPSPAALRRARDQMDHSISGMETGSKGEIIHMRRTSFFDRSSSPRVESSISPSYPPSSLKTTSPSNYLSHSASGAQLDAQQNDDRVSGSSSKIPKGTSSRKKRVPLKISPLVITGMSSLPSPMVAPMSAIPRQITLDRYFFTADQVHEWNIPSYGRVKFTDHAPLVFQAVRERFQYTLQDLDEALSQPMTVMRTPGKSDAVFFVSHNHGRFLLKTLRGSEPENLKNFLSDYMAHIHKHPNTLLPRYLGMYTFEKLSGSKMAGPGPGGHHHGGSHHYGRDGDRDPSFSFKAGGPGSKHDSTASHHHLHLNGTLLSGKDDGLPSKVIVVVLANVFDTANLVHERYDFKGSNVGRRTLSEQPPLTTVVPPTPTTDHSIGLDIPGADLFRRHSQRNQRRQEANFNRAQSSQHNAPESSPTAPVEATKEEISNLTLKEMDFQNRVNNGQTHLIHVGMAKRAEILSQLEDDTALLRKHGFMDYSMLVGIHLVPKATIACDVSESSAGGSPGSLGSDADYSSMDEDDEEEDVNDDGASSDEENKATTSVPDSKLQAVDRLLAVMNERGFLSHEQVAYLKKLKTATEETILEVVEMVQGSGENDAKDYTQDGPNPLVKTPRRQRSKDTSDWGAFRTPAGTIRQSFRSDARRVRSKAVGGSKGVRTHSHRRHHSRPLHRGSTSQDRSTPFKQRPKDAKRPTSPLQHKISLPSLFSTDNNINTWSQGVPSIGLPDGYEAVYYFGLIDILQRYNIVKWLERNLKGANARLLGPTTPSSSLAPPSVLSPQHPGRSTPSTSFSASSLYQLLPMASASEPSLPLTESSFPPSSTLSVLLENPASRPTSTVSLMDQHRYSQSVDKRSSTGTSNMSSGSSGSHHLSHSSTQGSSNGMSASKSATGLSSRLSHASHHSSQPSHHSGKSISMSHGNVRDHQGESVSGSSPPLPVVPLSSSPQASSSLQEQQVPMQMPRHQSQSSYQAFNQHAEVSVEEPGRYAERLVDFMRGVLV